MREYQRFQLVQEQIHHIELERLEAIRTANTPAIQQGRQLLQLIGLAHCGLTWHDNQDGKRRFHLAPLMAEIYEVQIELMDLAETE